MSRDLEPWVWPQRFDRYPLHLRASVEALVDEQLAALDEERQRSTGEGEGDAQGRSEGS